jgi:hypothetical protein
MSPIFAPDRTGEPESLSTPGIRASAPPRGPAPRSVYGTSVPGNADAPASRLALLRMPWEALEALGLCECGTPLADHPPLAPAKPLRSWQSQCELLHPLREDDRPRPVRVARRRKPEVGRKRQRKAKPPAWVRPSGPVAPGTCECGCSGVPKGAPRRRFCQGHDARKRVRSA